MKIAVVAANGKTGQRILEQAIERGHEVVAVLRRADALKPQAKRRIVVANLDDSGALQQALRGVDAVRCCLGPKVSVSGMFAEQTLLQEGVRNVSKAMDAVGVRRLVLLSAATGHPRPPRR